MCAYIVTHLRLYGVDLDLQASQNISAAFVIEWTPKKFQ